MTNTGNRPETPDTATLLTIVISDPDLIEARDAFRYIIQAQAQAAEHLHEAAVAIRERGMTWEQIGAELGITRQAAQQRYGA
jgi:hypothetical protein